MADSQMRDKGRRQTAGAVVFVIVLLAALAVGIIVLVSPPGWGSDDVDDELTVSLISSPDALSMPADMIDIDVDESDRVQSLPVGLSPDGTTFVYEEVQPKGCAPPVTSATIDGDGVLHLHHLELAACQQNCGEDTAVRYAVDLDDVYDELPVSIDSSTTLVYTAASTD